MLAEPLALPGLFVVYDPITSGDVVRSTSIFAVISSDRWAFFAVDLVSRLHNHNN